MMRTIAYTNMNSLAIRIRTLNLLGVWYTIHITEQGAVEVTYLVESI